MNTDAIHIVSTGLVGSYLYSGREYPDAKVFLLYSFHCLFHTLSVGLCMLLLSAD